jgi:hypothetical protein
MSRLARPHVWLALTLLVAAVVGAVLLADPACTRVEQEFLQVYGTRHGWQAAFDALSATCGVGLLTHNFEEDYTPRGRWTLTALGVVGAVLYLLAATQALRRLATAGAGPGRYIGDKTAGTEPGRYIGDKTAGTGPGRYTDHTATGGGRSIPPHPLLVATAFVVLLAVLLPVFWLVVQVGGAETSFSDAAWQASAAFASLGWTRDPQSGLSAWPVAVLAWIGALGWAAWVVVVPALRRRCVPVRGLCASVGGYVCFLLIAAGLVCALESPRAGRRGVERDGKALSSQAPPIRYAQSLVQTVCASGAGIPTEALSDRGVTEGTKITLGVVVLVGGMAGAAGGGIKWPLLMAVLVAGVTALGRAGRSGPERSASRYTLAGAACALSMLALASVVALGLLMIENHTASPYQPSPTFADAFLDASSAVGGANLSSGLTATVSSRNLITGMRQATNLYQYGMSWLMAAMLVGRLLPLFVLWRIADANRASTRPASPPLL